MPAWTKPSQCTSGARRRSASLRPWSLNWSRPGAQTAAPAAWRGTRAPTHSRRRPRGAASLLLHMLAVGLQALAGHEVRRQHPVSNRRCQRARKVRVVHLDGMQAGFIKTLLGPGASRICWAGRQVVAAIAQRGQCRAACHGSWPSTAAHRRGRAPGAARQAWGLPWVCCSSPAGGWGRPCPRRGMAPATVRQCAQCGRPASGSARAGPCQRRRARPRPPWWRAPNWRNPRLRPCGSYATQRSAWRGRAGRRAQHGPQSVSSTSTLRQQGREHRPPRCALGGG